MFGLKIFVRVQTFRRVPPVLPRNFCHPGRGCYIVLDYSPVQCHITEVRFFRAVTAGGSVNLLPAVYISPFSLIFCVFTEIVSSSSPTIAVCCGSQC